MKTEQYGKVKLNILDEKNRPPMTWARLYTPENGKEILESVRRITEGLKSEQMPVEEVPDFDTTFREHRNFPYIYHLSDLRANILRGMNLAKEDRILELGAGCGALTSYLVRKCAGVTAIETAADQCRINAERNRNASGLEIICGDVCQALDLLSDRKEKFDCITIVDSFHAMTAGMACPPSQLLRELGSLLTERGRILIADPNRLGFRYFSGWKNPLTGNYFDGLEGEADDCGSLYSRKEWEKMLEEAGYDYEFYYPYPDACFPMYLFSDSRLPVEDELNYNGQTLDQSRIELFDDRKVLNSLVNEGMFPEISNAFLIRIRPVGIREENPSPLYIKYSNERNPSFALYTEILRFPDGHTEVCKAAANPSAAGHLRRMTEIQKNLNSLYQPQGFRVNRTEFREDCAVIEFLKGSSYDLLVDKLLAEEGTLKAAEMIRRYLDAIIPKQALKPFHKTEKFIKVFGDITEEEAWQTLPVSDVDAIMENMVCDRTEAGMLSTGTKGEREATNGTNQNFRKENFLSGAVLIDYEWTFDFPIPADYIRWRILHYYIESQPWRKLPEFRKLYDEYGISEEKEQIFTAMERNFQAYIEGERVPLRTIQKNFRQTGFLKRTPVSLRTYEEKTAWQVFYKEDRDFKEEQSYLVRREDPPQMLRIEVPDSAHFIRIDPGSLPCVGQVLEISINGTNLEESAENYISDGTKATDKILPYEADGPSIMENMILFATEDPYIVVHVPDGRNRALYVRMETEPIPESFAEKMLQGWNRSEEKRTQAEDQLTLAKARIEHIEQNPAYKIYKKIRH